MMSFVFYSFIHILMYHWCPYEHAFENTKTNPRYHHNASVGHWATLNSTFIMSSAWPLHVDAAWVFNTTASKNKAASKMTNQYLFIFDNFSNWHGCFVITQGKIESCCGWAFFSGSACSLRRMSHCKYIVNWFLSWCKWPLSAWQWPKAAFP